MLLCAYIFLVVAIIFDLVTRSSFSCPVCGSRSCVSVRRDFFDDGEFRQCFRCNHWGFASDRDIKNRTKEGKLK